MSQTKKQVLFVDDDPELLELIRTLMTEYAGGSWEILLAPGAAEAFALLQERQFDLLVIDVHMPVLDGLQFLRVLQRKYPNLLKVVLTGDSTGAYRAACLNSGAELFLEKPRAVEGWHSVYATLNELAKFQPEQGFRGVLRRVGLEDVLQMECLARNSSVLEVSAGEMRGAIFIEDGRIIHAQAGELTGEEAFYYLLRLGGGDFNQKPFVAPSARTIEGSWEFLVMEAARKRDESSQTAGAGAGASGPTEIVPADEPVAMAQAMAGLFSEPHIAPAVAQGPPGNVPLRPQVDEVLVCSPQGDVLYEWQCSKTNARISFLEFLSQKARQLSQGLPLGYFDRLEIEADNSRIVTQIQADRALFVRTSRIPGGQPSGV